MKSGFLITFFNFFTRGVLGLGLIYFANVFLTGQGSIVQVGWNFLTFCTTGILGIPGVALLYGVQFFQLL